MAKITSEFWLLIIVAVVAAVGILILMSGSMSSVDLSGQATKALTTSKTKTAKSATCIDSDGGKDLTKKGTVSWSSYSKTDECYSEDSVMEYYCEGGEQKLYMPYCDEDYTCFDGACIEDTRADYVITNAEITRIYEETEHFSQETESFVDVEVTTENSGDVDDTNAQLTVHLEWEDNSLSYFVEDDGTTNGLSPGETGTNTVSIPLEGTSLIAKLNDAGTVSITVRVSVDTGDDIDESNEDNNEYETLQSIDNNIIE